MQSLNRHVSWHGSATTNTASSTVTGTSSGIRVAAPLSGANARSPSSNSKVENAVYAYIRAIRALGRTTVNTTDIAKALHLNVSAVDQAISSLRQKGVKRIG